METIKINKDLIVLSTTIKDLEKVLIVYGDRFFVPKMKSDDQLGLSVWYPTDLYRKPEEDFEKVPVEIDFSDIEWHEGWMKKDNEISKIRYFWGREGKFNEAMYYINPYLLDTSNAIQLSNGSFLIKAYGKYQPDICFISKVPIWGVGENIKFSDLNLPGSGYLEIWYGKYFISKKGTKCFELTCKEEAPHILVRDSWGGPSNSYRGRTLPENELFYLRSASNGGGAGDDYAIIPKGWTNRVNMEDI